MGLYRGILEGAIEGEARSLDYSSSSLYTTAAASVEFPGSCLVGASSMVSASWCLRLARVFGV